MNDAAGKGQYLTQRIGEKQVHELIGISRGLLADGHLNDAEIEFVHRWLVANDGARANPLVSILLQRMETALHDGSITDEERADLDSTLRALTAIDFELGEVLKANPLPLCSPAAAVDLFGVRICSLAPSR